MRCRGSDIDTDAGKVSVRSNRAFMIVAVVAVPLVFVPDDRHRIALLLNHLLISVYSRLPRPLGED